MRKWKTSLLIRSMSQTERERFLDWAIYAFKSSNPKLLTLFKAFLERNNPSEIWYEYRPNEPYEIHLLRRDSLELKRWIKEFLAVEFFRKNKLLKLNMTIKAVFKKGLPKIQEEVLKEMETELQKEKQIHNEEYFQYSYQTALAKQAFLTMYSPQSKENFMEEINLSYEVGWVHSNLRLACINWANQNIFGGYQTSSSKIELALGLAERHPKVSAFPTIQIYKKLFHLLQNNPEENIDQFIDLLKENKTFFAKHELQDIFYNLLNFHILKINKEESKEHALAIFSIYKWGMNEKFLLVNKILPWNHYRNIITSGFLAQKADLAYDYLQSLIRYLPVKDRKNGKKLGLAQYYFYSQKYKLVIDVLGKEKMTSSYPAISARLLQLKSYYELGERSALKDRITYSISTVRLHEAKVSPFFFNGYKIQLKTLLALVKADLAFPSAYRKQQLEDLKTEIETISELPQRKWFLIQVVKALTLFVSGEK